MKKIWNLNKSTGFQKQSKQFVLNFIMSHLPYIYMQFKIVGYLPSASQCNVRMCWKSRFLTPRYIRQF